MDALFHAGHEDAIPRPHGPRQLYTYSVVENPVHSSSLTAALFRRKPEDGQRFGPPITAPQAWQNAFALVWKPPQ